MLYLHNYYIPENTYHSAYHILTHLRTYLTYNGMLW